MSTWEELRVGICHQPQSSLPSPLCQCTVCSSTVATMKQHRSPPADSSEVAWSSTVALWCHTLQVTTGWTPHHQDWLKIYLPIFLHWGIRLIFYISNPVRVSCLIKSAAAAAMLTLLHCLATIRRLASCNLFFTLADKSARFVHTRYVFLPWNNYSFLQIKEWRKTS